MGQVRPRWESYVIGQPVHGPELPPNDWQGWTGEPAGVDVQQGKAVISAGSLAASARRHPAFTGLDAVQRLAALSAVVSPPPFPGGRG